MKLVTETVTTDVRDVNIRQLTRHQRGTIDLVVTMFKHIDDPAYPEQNMYYARLGIAPLESEIRIAS